LSVFVDFTNRPRGLAWLTTDEIMEHWFKPWTVGNEKIKFELLTQGRGDCHITFEPVDGPQGTLKFVWVPDGDVEFMY